MHHYFCHNLPILVCLLLGACSLEKGSSKSIRAHTEEYQGVEHGVGAMQGPRYCSHCHGKQLQGGINREPSCFQCHGINWDEKVKSDTSRAPADHTVINEVFHHHPGLATPATTCSNCHGNQLQGDKSLLTPPCLLCHEQKWD